MTYTDYIALNDHTDEKEWELIIRVFNNESSFGWYKYADSNEVVSDSQFDIGKISPDNAEEEIGERFNCYHVAELSKLTVWT